MVQVASPEVQKYSRITETEMARKTLKKVKAKSGSRKASPAKPPAKTPTEALVVRGIGCLYTLEGAALKKGRHILPGDLSPIPRAAMVLKNGRIEWTGPEAKLPREYKTLRAENLKGAVVIPAFVECHTHLIYAGNRAGEFERRNQGESYQSIAESGGGILATVLPTRTASEKELARIGQERVERFLRQGVSTIETKSGYALTLDGELKMLKSAGLLKRARIVRTFLGAHAIPQEASSAETYIDDLIKNYLPKVKKLGLACRVDIFVEKGYFVKDLARRYLLAAKALGFDLAVHADQLTRSGGANLAVELGARSAEHLLQINASDIAELAASEVTCVLLPGSDLYMNCTYPPARALIDRGARVALATDFNPGSAPSQDIALAGILARVQMKMSLQEVIAAYTIGAAYALGLERELGSLTPGKLCDFVVLEGGIEELFLEIGRQPVARLYREGRRLV
jgi:imidazolonepropionase